MRDKSAGARAVVRETGVQDCQCRGTGVEIQRRDGDGAKDEEQRISDCHRDQYLMAPAECERHEIVRAVVVSKEEALE